MLASSIIVENIPLLPRTPQIVIELPTNTPHESNYNSRTNLNGLFIQPNNTDWTSGTPSPGSCFQNLLAPYYWSTNHRYHDRSTYENSLSHGNLKDEYHIDKRSLLSNQSVYLHVSRTPPPLLFTPSSPTSSQYSNQNRNSYCCLMNSIATKAHTSNQHEKFTDFQRSSSISLASSYNTNKSVYLENCTDNYIYQQQLDRSSRVHRSSTTKSFKINKRNSFNRSLSPYSFYNYPQTINLSRQYTPCCSAESQCSSIEMSNCHNVNHSDSFFLSKSISSKMQQQIKRRASSSLSYQSCNSSIATTISYNDKKTNYINNCQVYHSMNKCLSTIQRSHSLPNLSIMHKCNDFNLISTKRYNSNWKTIEHNHDNWLHYRSGLKFYNFYSTPLQSNRNLLYPIDLSCQQQQLMCTSAITNHRRHTEACSHHPKTSLLLQSNRRSNSVRSQHTDYFNKSNNTTIGNIVNSMRNVNIVNKDYSGYDMQISNHSFLQPSNQMINEYMRPVRQPISLLVNTKLDNNHSSVESTSIHKQSTEMNEIQTMNPDDLELNKLGVIQNITDLHMNKGDSFTRCLCSLIVLLVCMQLTVGIASTALGLFLTWKVPELEPKECAYLSGIPLVISGFIGTFICFRHRFPSISPELMNIIQLTSGILSFGSFIICLITSVYAGQKGSEIASYENTCRTVEFKQKVQQSLVETTNKALYPVTMNYSNINHYFIEPCCYEIVKNTCECFTITGERIACYHNLSCRLLFSSIKDYIILQSALMGVGSGVSLWSWLLFIENKLKYLLNSKYVRMSFSSTRSSVPETSIGQFDEKTSSLDELDLNKSVQCSILNNSD
ncbi:hypothetical protein MN116_006469 [Schistosoma mekongi]|uniref:Uncharacterized protein n=1 Tax=Schistosoma mekongi TaxID=38744 RepID=A0AAE2D4J1_SCHME|nr:hypothetical protein MN116_006469 [Schistosoma mekongi]